MAKKIKNKYREVKCRYDISSKNLNEDQELMERMLPTAMIKHWPKIDFSNSIDEKMTVWIYLYKEYQCKFNKNQIQKLLKPTKDEIEHRQDLRHIERVRHNVEDEEFVAAVLENLQDNVVVYNNVHEVYWGHRDVWDEDLMEGLHCGMCLGCNVTFKDGDEYLELECTHIEHLDCIIARGRGNDPKCTACDALIRKRN